MASFNEFLKEIPDSSNKALKAAQILEKFKQLTDVKAYGFNVQVNVIPGCPLYNDHKVTTMSFAWICGNGEILLKRGNEGYYDHNLCPDVYPFSDMNDMVKAVNKLLWYVSDADDLAHHLNNIEHLSNVQVSEDKSEITVDVMAGCPLHDHYEVTTIVFDSFDVDDGQFHLLTSDSSVHCDHPVCSWSDYYDYSGYDNMVDLVCKLISYDATASAATDADGVGTIYLPEG